MTIATMAAVRSWKGGRAGARTRAARPRRLEVQLQRPRCVWHRSRPFGSANAATQRCSLAVARARATAAAELATRRGYEEKMTGTGGDKLLTRWWKCYLEISRDADAECFHV